MTQSVLILYDRADDHPVLAGDQPLSVECYSPDTAAFMGQIVDVLGFSPVIEGDLRRLMALAGSGFPTIFSGAINLSTGLPASFRAGQAATLFEMMGLPYTGCDPQALLLCRDKALTKRVAEAVGVAVPPGVVVTPDTVALARSLDPVLCPVLSKPNAESSSIGIEDNLFASLDQAYPFVEAMVADHPEGVLIEHFVPGLELTVVAVGNPPDMDLIPLVMRETCGAALSPEFVRSFSHKVANAKAEHTRWHRADAHLPAAAVTAITEVARTLILALKLRDFSRLDFRMGADGVPVFIEANGQPALTPGNSFSGRVNALWYDRENGLETTMIERAFRRMGLVAA